VLLRQCRTLVLAMITAWRWDRDDQFPNGRRLAREWLGDLRSTLEDAARYMPAFRPGTCHGRRGADPDVDE
jgi:hypothetical protein